MSRSSLAPRVVRRRSAAGAKKVKDRPTTTETTIEVMMAKKKLRANPAMTTAMAREKKYGEDQYPVIITMAVVRATSASTLTNSRIRPGWYRRGRKVRSSE